MKDDVSKESEAGRQETEAEMAKAKAESRKLRAESDHGEGANFQRSTTTVKRSASNYESRRINLAEGERKFVEALMKFTAGAKRSREPEVAVAARRWEGKIHFHVRVTLQRRRKA